MKIVSLLPSATEIVCGLGLDDELVAITHECDHPSHIADRPAVTASRISHETMSSREIDHAVRSQLDGHGTIYDLDEARLEQIAPDLILTQELCEVCAVSYKLVRNAAKVLKADTTIVSLEPNTISDIFDTILTVGELANVPEAAAKYVSELTARLDAVQNQTADAENKPRVMMLEWLDPPFSPGHWVPEQVEIAGGLSVMGQPGGRSETISYDDILRQDPEVLVLIPCGYYIGDILRQLQSTAFPSNWQQMSAIKAGNVWAMDATSYFSRPGPRVVDGSEILAKVLHPEIFGEPAASEAVRVDIDELRFLD